MRTFDLNGKKRGVRLDTRTWGAIDQLATQAGCKWAALARQWAGNDPKDSEENLTAVIRAGAMAGVLALQQVGNIATATAAATQTPGVIRIDWTSTPAAGSFLLDAKEAENLAQTLASARLTSLADVLEAGMPSEEDKEEDGEAELRHARLASRLNARLLSGVDAVIARANAKRDRAIARAATVNQPKE